MQLQAKELLDIRHAMQASLESEEEEDWGVESPEEPPPSISSGDEKEEEEKQQPLSPWTREVKKTKSYPFIFPSGKQHAARHVKSPLEFLQLFLHQDLMQQI